jgi:predicted acetyltransferase
MRIKTRDEGSHHIRELWIDNEMVSFLTVIDHQMRIGSAQVRMGGIGGVETKKKHRKKGYMRTLMEDTIAYMKQEGYDVSMLFGISNFYTKFGYAVCLPSHKCTLATRDAEAAKKDAGDHTIRNIEKEDLASVLALYNANNVRRTCSIVRTKEVFSGFRRGSRYGRPADRFLIEDDHNKLLAYAVFDKSEQEVDVVEVESREDRLFPALLYEFAKMAIERRCGHISLFMPPDHPFAEFAHRVGCECITQYSKNGGGMMRIISQEALFEKIKGELGRRIADSKFGDYSGSLRIRTDIGNATFEIRDGLLDMASGQESECSLDLPQAKLIQLLVGYRTVRDILSDSDVEASHSLAPLLPILFPETVPYVWSADHF